MAFQKFTASEHTEVLTPEQHKAAQAELRRQGKTSARDLDAQQRETFGNAIDAEQ